MSNPITPPNAVHTTMVTIVLDRAYIVFCARSIVNNVMQSIVKHSATPKVKLTKYLVFRATPSLHHR